MGNSNGKITAPVSLHADVYPVLGLTKTGAYYDTGWVCGNSHGRINIWARNKPVRVNTPSEITDSQRHSVSFGLQRTPNGSSYTWSYLPPRPGTDWCRLTDFNGYDHNSACGLSFKTYNFTKDLFGDKTALTVALQDSTSLITAYDLRDTIFKGMTIGLLMTNREGSGQAYATNINIDRQSLVFTIPYDQLLLRGAGTYNLTVSLFPPEYQRATLTMTNDTGIMISKWSDGSITFEIKDENGSYYLWSEYQVGHGDNVLNLTGMNLDIDTLSPENDGKTTINNTNMFFQFEWDVPTGRAIKRVPMVDLTNLDNGGSWTVGPGSGSAGRYGCLDNAMPKLTTESQVNRYTTLCIAYKHTDGIFYSVTPKVTMRIKRDNGTDPDFINPN